MESKGRPFAVQRLKQAIDRVPRVPLTYLPTPLQWLPRLSKALGGPKILMKRDDLTGLAFGGNKSRMFEFLLAKAVEEGADTVVGGAGVQSNYARQLVAACNVLGLETHLVPRRIRGTRDDVVQGNLLLYLLAGARVHIITGDQDDQRTATFALAEQLKRQGKRPFVVRMANDRDLSPDVIAYVNCFLEIVEQSQQMEVDPTHIYVASYDSTQAGLELGKAALGSSISVVGVAPANWHHGVAGLVARYANQAAMTLGLSCRVAPRQVFNTEEYVGAGYGIPTPEGVEMIKLVARTEGVFLDPVYTSKAMAALRDHIQKGLLTVDDVVVFVHTGGAPALFAYVEDLHVEKPMEYSVYGGDEVCDETIG